MRHMGVAAVFAAACGTVGGSGSVEADQPAAADTEATRSLREFERSSPAKPNEDLVRPYVAEAFRDLGPSAFALACRGRFCQVRPSRTLSAALFNSALSAMSREPVLAALFVQMSLLTRPEPMMLVEVDPGPKFTGRHYARVLQTTFPGSPALKECKRLFPNRATLDLRVSMDASHSVVANMGEESPAADCVRRAFVQALADRAPPSGVTEMPSWTFRITFEQHGS